MQRLLRAGLFSLGVLAYSAVASAGTLNLFPGSAGVDGVVGNTSTSAPGFPNSSFQANSTSSLDNPQKSQIYVDPVQLFGHSITVGDIASMSYWTNKSGASNTPDWSLYIYTNFVQGGDNTGTFYQSRLTAEPLYSNPPDVDPNTWHQWSTNDPNSPLKFYDAVRSGAQGTATDPTLAGLQNNGGSFTWSGTNITHDYNDEVVKYLSFQTGSAWAAGFSGLLDGFNIQLSNNETGAINFEAVAPVPSSVWGGLVLLAGFAVVKFRRRGSIA